ncbi:MAG TPA: Gfo/Idh/MocA family oxidoreductase [Alphaproteobacteria bacterium]|nr:Gfo/Idh/MocA family oxidoreductase [Alphaproteobacteria bacterium]
MNLNALLGKRAEEGRPIKVGLIGAGKFGTMFLAQALRTPGLQLVGIADLSPARAQEALVRTGWPAERIAASSFAAALEDGSVCLTDDAEALIAAPGLEVVIEATGVPTAGLRHAMAALRRGRHVVMVTVEADVLAGPLLARKAREAGVVYSMAYGDQPALIAEQVDWARAIGLDVVAAGKGTKYLPAYHQSTPETVWPHYGITAEAAAAGGMNAQMFNSFLDGTKSAIEMAAVANATGLVPQAGGLGFPPAGVDDLPRVCRPREEGGVLAHKGTVEVVSSLKRDGSAVLRDLRWGVYVSFEAPSDYVKRCFAEYGLLTDDSGRYAALYRPYHLIGLELGVSVASAALRGEATGSARAFMGDAVAVAKRDLKEGEVLDGEGGYMVYGKLMPAERSLAGGCLPIGLAHKVKLTAGVKAGTALTWSDVALDGNDLAVRLRREMEAAFGRSNRPQAAQ